MAAEAEVAANHMAVLARLVQVRKYSDVSTELCCFLPKPEQRVGVGRTSYRSSAPNPASRLQTKALDLAGQAVECYESPVDAADEDAPAVAVAAHK